MRTITGFFGVFVNLLKTEERTQRFVFLLLFVKGKQTYNIIKSKMADYRRGVISYQSALWGGKFVFFLLLTRQIWSSTCQLFEEMADMDITSRLCLQAFYTSIWLISLWPHFGHKLPPVFLRLRYWCSTWPSCRPKVRLHSCANWLSTYHSLSPVLITCKKCVICYWLFLLLTCHSSHTKTLAYHLNRLSLSWELTVQWHDDDGGGDKTTSVCWS